MQDSHVKPIAAGITAAVLFGTVGLTVTKAEGEPSYRKAEPVGEIDRADPEPTTPARDPEPVGGPEFRKAEPVLDIDDPESGPEKRTVFQEPGKITYWVLPGPRKLDPAVFGTPGDPNKATRLKPRIKQARQQVKADRMPPSIPQLLKDLPILVGVPMKARSTTPEGDWVLKMPNPFGNEARIIEGQFTATFTDVVDHDTPGKPGQTPDSATMEATFKDPAGNAYRAVLDHVVMPPLPGYETDGGVLLDGTHHGDTGTGSPLMPEVETIAAFWGVGKLFVNGEPTGDMHMMHLMTTEVVRDRDYHLVFEKDLPLPPEERQIQDQTHHTHLVILPVTPRQGGPVFNPLPTAFELPNGKKQPFIHVMFEEDTVD
ncbi:MAG: hypothetical protein ACFE0O_10690 [Opitutales bacterium]